MKRTLWILVILLAVAFSVSAGQNILTDNGDGTITDSRTGLMWVKNPPQRPMSWIKAARYIQSLNVGDHDDWRFPTQKELRSLCRTARSIKRGQPCLILRQSVFGRIQCAKYWAGTVHPNFRRNLRKGYVRMVDMGTGGSAGPTRATYRWYVLPVRTRSLW